ncbi:MAG: hypothetical protein ACTSUT_14690 [Promethearchaeota archaeon]
MGKCKKIILMGQSFGSFMAQPFFHRNFRKIEGLILINGYPPKEEWVDSYKKMIKILKFVPFFLLKKLMTKKILTLVDKEMEMPPEIREEFNFNMAFVRERFSKVEKSVMRCQTILTGEFNGEKYNDQDYTGWNGKVIIFTANDDKGFPYHKDLKGQYPRAQTQEIIFKDVRHIGTLLKRDEYHAILNEFLDSLS